MEVRNSANSAFNVLRVADAIGNDDAITLRQFNARTVTITTASAAQTLATGDATILSITVGASGLYLVDWNASLELTAANVTVTMRVFSNGVLVTDSTRLCGSDGGLLSGTQTQTVTVVATATLSAGQVIAGRAFRTGGALANATMQGRSLRILGPF